MKAEHNQTKIAEIVNVHKSTVSCEVRRNRGLRGYPGCQNSCRCAKKEDDSMSSFHAVSMMRVGPSVSPIRR